MNAHPENSFIFITPYLKEIERIKQGTKVAFYDPKNYQRPDLLGGDFRLKSKLDDFNHLLAILAISLTFFSVILSTYFAITGALSDVAVIFVSPKLISTGLL